jgi:hypothetical protein
LGAKYQPISPLGLKTTSLRFRAGKVCVDDFARVHSPDARLSRFIRNLPNFLAARDFREFLGLLGKARKRRKAIIAAMGAHVLKVGLSPVLIDLMKNGWISAIALNGAGVIHDFEIAFCGRTSEDVESRIKKGRFGMARETGEMLNEAVRQGAEMGLGMGEAVAGMIARSKLPYKRLSLLGSAYRLGIPVTVHVAIGTDTIHFHPRADGEALGKTSMKDFYLFSGLVRRLDGGGVFMNIGSAVILPEVFLKAVSFVRNKGYPLENFSAAVFDFIHHYRPDQNVVRRPLGKKGKGFYFIGPHEILIPLLAAALKSVRDRP